MLVKYNEDKITNPNLIFPGQVINVPSQWFKPKNTELRPIKVDLTINNQPKEAKMANIVFAYDSANIRPMTLTAPFGKVTVKFAGKLVLGSKEGSPTIVELSNTGISASAEQKIESVAGELARKVDIKYDQRTNDISVKSTLTIASFGPNAITVSHNFEYKKAVN